MGFERDKGRGRDTGREVRSSDGGVIYSWIC